MKKPSHSKLFLLILLSLLVALVSLIIVPVTLKPAEKIGLFGLYLGTAFALFIIPLIIAKIIAFNFNLFKKEKRDLSYPIVWLIFILISGSTLFNSFLERKNAPLVERQQFVQGCIDGYKQTQQDKQQPNAEAYCNNIANHYFDCMKQIKNQNLCIAKIKSDIRSKKI